MKVYAFFLLFFCWDQAVSNEICRRNGIASFHIQPGLPFESREYCESVKPIPAPLVQFLQRLGEINQRTAKVLQLPFSEVFSKGVPITVEPSPIGPMHAFASRSIEVAVFPDWNGEEFPDSIYAHELGHWVSMRASTPYLELLRRLQRSVVTKESLADLFALSTIGHLSLGDEFPGCLKELKSIFDREWSFSLPTGYFDKQFQWRKLNTCCENLRAEGTPTARAEGICRTLEDVYFKKFATSIRSIPSLESSDLDLAKTLSDESVFDSHPLGNPLTRFVEGVAKGTGRSVAGLFFGSLKKVVEEKRGSRFTCYVPALRKEIAELKFTTASLIDVFEVMRDSLGTDGRTLMGQLSMKFRVDRAEAVFSLETDKFSWMDADQKMFRVLSEFTKNHPDHPLVEGSGCFENGFWVTKKAACTLVCDRE